MDRKIISKLINKKRKVKGLSQKELAFKLGFSTSQFISNIERGLADIPVNKAVQFAKILDIDESEFLGLISERAKSKTLENAVLGNNNLSKNIDPFLKNFIVAWESADTETKTALKHLLSKILNI